MQKISQAWKAQKNRLRGKFLQYLNNLVYKFATDEICNLDASREREAILDELEDFFVELDRNEPLRQKIFTYDFGKLGLSQYYPLILKKELPDSFYQSSTKDFFIPTKVLESVEENKEIIRALNEFGIIRINDLVWSECKNHHIIFFSREQLKEAETKKNSRRCVMCKEPWDAPRDIYFCKPRVINLILSRGKIIEPFLFWKIDKLLKSRSNSDLEIYWGPHKKYEFAHWHIYKEMDIYMSRKSDGKNLVVLSSISPTCGDEKKQHSFFKKAKIETIMVTTRNSKSLEGYGDVCTNLFPEIYTQGSINNFMDFVTKYFDLN